MAKTSADAEAVAMFTWLRLFPLWTHNTERPDVANILGRMKRHDQLLQEFGMKRISGTWLTKP
ncbi:hypothetical protein NXW13_00805 [Bacteroides thetaiotaomicron]|nr:hypothetical protein [Bacteroides thetaiotaomicron]